MVLITSIWADILPGDFLIAVRVPSENRGFRGPVVCQVQSINAPDKLNVIWWVQPDVPPYLSDTVYENVHRCKNKELLKEGTVYTIHVDSMLDVAFVFHAHVTRIYCTSISYFDTKCQVT